MLQMTSLLPVSLSAYLAYITEQLWLPHCKCKAHSKHTKWAHGPTIFVHMCLHLTTIHTSHVITKYAPERKMTTKMGLYAIYSNYLMGLCRCIHMYMPHMMSLQSAMQLGALYKNLTYITEQI